MIDEVTGHTCIMRSMKYKQEKMGGGEWGRKHKKYVF